MFLKVSVILIAAGAVMGGVPISSYYSPPQIASQQYPLYQQFLKQPTYLTPVYQYYQPKIVRQPAIQAPVFQIQPAFVAKAPGPILQEPRKLVLQEPETATPNYSFAYAVNDEKTGDQKSHQESRKGDNVVGKYTVVEPDGTLRIVTYTAGKEGFNAVVERQPPAVSPTPIQVPQKQFITHQHLIPLQQQFPVRKIVAQSQPIFSTSNLYQPQAPSPLNFSNYYYK